MNNILEVKDLTMHYETIDGDVEAVKNISSNSCSLNEFYGAHQIDSNLKNIIYFEIKGIF